MTRPRAFALALRDAKAGGGTASERSYSTIRCPRPCGHHTRHGRLCESASGVTAGKQGAKVRLELDDICDMCTDHGREQPLGNHRRAYLPASYAKGRLEKDRGWTRIRVPWRRPLVIRRTSKQPRAPRDGRSLPGSLAGEETSMGYIAMISGGRRPLSLYLFPSCAAGGRRNGSSDGALWKHGGPPSLLRRAASVGPRDIESIVPWIMG
ncbi:hypothetical protein GQ53DRAFT_426844 [Thozetella sp. PMI_491]|nr:hypothetical protein GQ53DRAFT_426844 [Thozetella sp. PMI_491]